MLLTIPLTVLPYYTANQILNCSPQTVHLTINLNNVNKRINAYNNLVFCTPTLDK